jgi:hypothetical protein
MRRGLWFVAGAGVGIYAVIRGKRAAEALTVDGMTDRLKGAQVGWHLFREEVATGKVEKETELRERFALAPHGRPELTTGDGGRAARPARTPTTDVDDKDTD